MKKKSIGCSIPFPTLTGLVSPCCKDISAASEILKCKLKEMASSVHAELQEIHQVEHP